jgi:AcrR family transcriptional regulator
MATPPPAHAEPPLGRRARLRAEALTSIKQAALDQLREQGASALSLRAVARAVGMSSPGVYRYFASRDELLTALIADAYDDLAAALEAARDAGGPSAAARLRAVALGYADWARAHPAEFSLVFGPPVPTYQAPADGDTTRAVRRFGAVWAGLLAEALPSSVAAPALPVRPDGVLSLAGVAVPDDPRFLGALMRLWTRLHGVLALGLYGHLLPATLADGAVQQLYEAEVDAALAELGIVASRPIPSAPTAARSGAASTRRRAAARR